MLNFPSPEADYALLPLIGVTTLTALPLWIALLVKICVYWIKRAFYENKTPKTDIKVNQNENKKFIPTTENSDCI